MPYPPPPPKEYDTGTPTDSETRAHNRQTLCLGICLFVVLAEVFVFGFILRVGG